MDMKDIGPERGAAAFITPVSLVRDDLTQPMIRCDASKGDEDHIDISSRNHRPELRRPRRSPPGLPDERVRELRRRIEAGRYDTPEVAEEVARRMLESGDI